MSVPITPRNKVFFSVQVLDNLEGKKLKALKPDAHGYYDVCLAMLDATSRNSAYYDVDSIVHEITTPSTVFNMMLTQGNLRGEFGHPPITSPIERIDAIVEDRVSHHIAKLWTGERTERGIPLFGKIKPSGPFGHLVETSLQNPCENTTFSLRCLMTQRQDNVNRRMHRTVKRLVTFDYVNMPGYLEASKWFSPGNESFMREITPEMIFNSNGQRIGLESWSDRDLADLFGISEFQLTNMKLGTQIKGTTTYFDIAGIKRSMTHAILSKK